MGRRERRGRCEQSGAPPGGWLMVFLLGWAWRWSVQGTGAPPPSQCMQYIPPTPGSFRPHNCRTIFTRLDSASLRLYSRTKNFYLYICSERSGTIIMALVHMISLR